VLFLKYSYPIIQFRANSLLKILNCLAYRLSCL